jgi:hypothetical protein
MPNLWSTTNRKVYEVFYGPRTVDLDFNRKVEEIKSAEIELANLQHVLHRFHHYQESHKDHASEISVFLANSYDSNSPYWAYTNEASIVNRELEKLHASYLENIANIGQTAKLWEIKLNDIKNNLKERDNLRFTHDHYDAKMEKYVKERNRRLERNSVESPRFIAAFERVIYIIFNFN